MTEASTNKLLARAGALAAEATLGLSGGGAALADAVAALAEAARRQEARIAALERLHPTAGLPLEGMGPLPLERKGA